MTCTRFSLLAALLGGLMLTTPSQACVVKTGKDCASTVANKVNHQVKLNKPGLAGGLGAVAHITAPVALGAAPVPVIAAPQQVVQTHPSAVFRPADMPLRPNQYFITVRGRTSEVNSASAQRNPGITNPDGTLTPHAIANGWTMVAHGPAAPNMVQAPAMQTVQAPPLASQPLVEVYGALHADLKFHEHAYDAHDPAFHLVVRGFKEP